MIVFGWHLFLSLKFLSGVKYEFLKHNFQTNKYYLNLNIAALKKRHFLNDNTFLQQISIHEAHIEWMYLISHRFHVTHKIYGRKFPTSSCLSRWEMSNFQVCILLWKNSRKFLWLLLVVKKKVTCKGEHEHIHNMHFWVGVLLAHEWVGGQSDSKIWVLNWSTVHCQCYNSKWSLKHLILAIFALLENLQI